MKQLITMLMLGASVCAFAAGDLAGARAQIGDAIANPDKIASIMKDLSNEDQQTFVGEMNAAIDSKGGSNEEKAAAFINANKAALKSAKKGNLANLVAEVFATVPPEMLTVLNERFAEDLFNRGADPTSVPSDETFTKIAQNLIAKIADRAAKTDDAAVRSTFGILMMVNASGGTPENLASMLVSALPEESREIAMNEWIPAALGDGQSKSYDALLSGMKSEPSAEPNVPMTLRIAGPQALEALLADLSTSAVYSDVAMSFTNAAINPPMNAFGTTLDYGLDAVPRGPHGKEWEKVEEPGGYQWQEL